MEVGYGDGVRGPRRLSTAAIFVLFKGALTGPSPVTAEELLGAHRTLPPPVSGAKPHGVAVGARTLDQASNPLGFGWFAEFPLRALRTVSHCLADVDEVEAPDLATSRRSSVLGAVEVERGRILLGHAHDDTQRLSVAAVRGRTSA
jgi:hypothetical protein